MKLLLSVPVIAALMLGTGLSLGTSLPSAKAEASDDAPKGTVVARVDGKEIDLPLLKADYDVAISGDVARVRLTQTFLNPTRTPLNATYLFPLNQKAAIHAMSMRVGEETIRAVIQEKTQAEKTFEKAKSEGKAATLLTQHRPNMFTQSIANLMPGATVAVTLSYVQTVPKVDNAYELVVPMIVGPRYEGAPEAPRAAPVANIPGDDTVTVSGWQIDRLPAYPQVIGLNAPGDIDTDRVGLTLSLKAAFPISALWSDTHALTITGSETEKTATFKAGRAIGNRDFVLRYELAAEKDIAAGVLSHFDAEKGGFLSLMIEPPKVPDEHTVTPRELVFVLDTSGSMTGLPMEVSKTFMRAALKALRPDDYFRILRFSNNTTAFAHGAVRATEANKTAAQAFVSGLSAGGGTEMNRAINAAFDTAQPANTMRIVVFLTDGYIGADREVIATVARRIGNARIYAFGIGNSVNRFLLEGMAREGRGYVRYVDVGETAYEAAGALAATLKTPLLTDIAVDWNGLAVTDQSPARIPDLFQGGSVRVFARTAQGGTHTIFVTGLVNGRKARMPVTVTLPDAFSTNADGSEAIPLIWAREQIFEKNRQYTIGGNAPARLKDEIIRLGLDFSLQSRFTSFVAVSEKVVNAAPHTARDKSVPLPQVSGVTKMAYPNLNLSGSSTPEPEGILGALMTLVIAIAGFWRRLKRAFGRLLARRRPKPLPLCRDLPATLMKDGWWLERR